jgi:6-phosphogluconolactonase
MLRVPVILILAAVSACSQAAGAEVFVQVSARTDKQLILFRMDPETGSLTPVERIAAGGEPAALTVTPDRRFLLASLRAEGKLASFRIDRATGKLRPINTVEAGEDPGHIKTDHTGRYLFTAYYISAKVSVHGIGTDGSITEQPLQEIATDTKAHTVALDPSDRFLFVPHTGPNRIFQFRWNSEKGRLWPNVPAAISTGQGTGPRHLAWHPTRPIAYVDNEQAGSMTAYHLDSASGLLSPLSSISTLPPGYKGPVACSEIKMHPTGRFVYVANRGHDSIAKFSLGDDPEHPVSLGQIKTEANPRSIEIDPTGRFLLAAGEGSGYLSIYRIAPATGSLTLAQRYQVAPDLWWVQAVELEPKNTPRVGRNDLRKTR